MPPITCCVALYCGCKAGRAKPPLVLQNRLSSTFHHVTRKPVGLKDCLRAHLKLSRIDAEKLIRLGSVYWENERLVEDTPLPERAHLRVYKNPQRYPVHGIRWIDRVVHQADSFVVIDKPHGVPTHATVDNVAENVLAEMRSLLKVPLYVTHRLDTGVGGLLLFAKTQSFQRIFNQALQQGGVSKTYLALTEVAPKHGVHVHYMDPSQQKRRLVQAEAKAGFDRCELEVIRSHKIETHGVECFEVEVKLLTGRTHQIRAQLAALGAPIIGDKLYGSRKHLEANSRAIQLYCSELKFADHLYKRCPSWQQSS